MKKYTILSALALLTFFAVFASNVRAQNANETDAPAASKSAEIMTENDRLPFMQSGEDATRPKEPGTGGLLVKTLGAMLLIVGLLFFGAWGLKKSGFGTLKAQDSAGAPDLAVLSSISVASGRTISAIRFGERVLLVASTPQSFTLLAEEEKKSVSTPVSRSVAELLADETDDFGEALKQAENRFELWEDRGERS